MQDRRKTKQQLIEELAALRHSEAQFRTLLELLPEAITLADLSGGITFANQQAARLHGFAAPDDMLAHSVYSLIAPHEQATVSAAVRQAVLNRASRNIETKLVRQDGTAFWAELTVTSWCD